MIKTFFKIIALLLGFATALVCIIFLSLGLVLSHHAGRPHKADVIVVLGGDNGLRIKKGAQLYKEGFAPHVLLTGIDPKFYRPGHPNWRERRMRALGVPKKAIKLDTESETTWEEAVNTEETMQKKGWKSALVISDPPHMLRLHQTWGKVFEGTGKKITLVPTEPEWWTPLLWWKNRTSYRFVVSEIKKNIYYLAIYL